MTALCQQVSLIFLISLIFFLNHDFGDLRIDRIVVLESYYCNEILFLRQQISFG